MPTEGSYSRRRNVQWFRGGLVFKAPTLSYHSTLGSRVLKKKKKSDGVAALPSQCSTPPPPG